MAWAKRRENNPDVRVTLSTFATPVFASDALGGQTSQQIDTRSHLSIIVRNHGYRDVSLPKDCCTLEKKGHETVSLPASPDLPVTLKHGESIRLVAAPGFARGAARGMRAVVSDQLARRYRSAWVRFQLDETTGKLSQ
jgi:hypothetical protein